MPRFERVCPNCGASSAYDKTHCSKCRAPLTGNAYASPPVQDFFSRKGMAKLAWRATKFMTVMGMRLAWRTATRGAERVRERGHTDVKADTIDGDYIVPADAPKTNLSYPPAREWRVWRGDADDDTIAPDTLHWGSTPKQKSE